MKNVRARILRKKHGNHTGPCRERACNICQSTFKTYSPFRRFCDHCRSRSEVYRLAEWLPQTTVVT